MEDLKERVIWSLDMLSIFRMSWDSLRDAQCIFVAYIVFLHDYHLKIPIQSLVQKYQLFHQFESSPPLNSNDEIDRILHTCREEIYEICIWLNYGMIHLGEYRGECIYQRYTDNK